MRLSVEQMRLRRRSTSEAAIKPVDLEASEGPRRRSAGASGGALSKSMSCESKIASPFLAVKAAAPEAGDLLGAYAALIRDVLGDGLARTDEVALVEGFERAHALRDADRRVALEKWRDRRSLEAMGIERDAYVWERAPEYAHRDTHTHTHTHTRARILSLFLSLSCVCV